MNNIGAAAPGHPWIAWRWRTTAALAALYGLAEHVGPGAGSAGSLATVLFGASLISLMATAPLAVTLSTESASTPRTAAALRVALGTGLGTAMALTLMTAELISFSILSLAALSVLTWAILAVTTRLHPIPTDGRFAAMAVVDEDAPPNPVVGVHAALRRAFDIIASGTILLFVSPVLAIVALAIKLDDGGPVFFRQRRMAFRSGSFEMLKFRSMVLDAEAKQHELAELSQRNGPLFKLTNDPRVTRIGRIIRDLSIDELPQLINVLRGDMSLVGPRPALPHEAAEFDVALSRRTEMKPGLTGLWQAEARSNPDFARFRELDLAYMQDASASLDLFIILATATEVLTRALAAPLGAIGIDVGPVDGITPSEESDDLVIDLRDQQIPAEPPSTPLHHGSGI